MADDATHVAANLLNALAQRFLHAQWPELPNDWNVLKDAEPGTPGHARLETLGALCAAAREELQAELMRPEIVLLILRLRLESTYMTVIWLLVKTNLPFELMDPALARKTRAAIIFNTAYSVPRAFDAFFGAVKAGGIPSPMSN